MADFVIRDITTASGKPTKSELAGVGEEEFNPVDQWRGVSTSVYNRFSPQEYRRDR